MADLQKLWRGFTRSFVDCPPSLGLRFYVRISVLAWPLHLYQRSAIGVFGPPTTVVLLGDHVNRKQRIKYYDDLLEENTQRVINGLSTTAEYQRLDYLIGELLAPEGGCVNAVAREAEEVMDFLSAFERLLGPELLIVN